MFAKKIENKFSKVNFSDLSGLLSLIKDELYFQFNVKDFEAAQMEYNAQNIIIEGAFDQSRSLKNLHLKFPEMDVETGFQGKQNINLDVLKVETDKYDLTVQGKMEPIDILVGKNFIGNLPASDFRMDSRLAHQRSMRFQG